MGAIYRRRMTNPSSDDRRSIPYYNIPFQRKVFGSGGSNDHDARDNHLTSTFGIRR